MQHSNLVKIVAAGLLDPKRAWQAMEETRNAMFSKLNSYIQMLHAMGTYHGDNTVISLLNVFANG